MIEVKNITKKYGKKLALDDVSFDLPRGQIVGLFGENGAGKTSLMKSILGFHHYQGEVLLDGEPITHKNIAKLSFATSEHSFFANLNARDHEEFYAEHFERFSHQRFSALMDFFELPYAKKLKSFSMGQKNQFEVILALSQAADYILMDEPFAGNDVFNREDFYKVLLGILQDHETVLLSTHLIEEVSDFIGRAILLHEGKIVGDITTEELETRGQDLMRYIKSTYDYRADRVSRALDEISGEG